MTQPSENEPLKIAIAEDHTFLRQTMENMLDKEKDYKVVFGAKNGLELISKLQYHTVDIVVLDLEMPVMGGQEAMKFIHRVYPSLKILVLSMHDDDARVKKYFELGAKGFLSKDCDYHELKTAIETLRDDRIFLDNPQKSDLYRNLKSEKRKYQTNIIDEPLTSREIEILKLLCYEKTNREIAIELELSPRTVENHCMHLRRKTGATNTIGLVVYALKNGIVRID